MKKVIIGLLLFALVIVSYLYIGASTTVFMSMMCCTFIMGYEQDKEYNEREMDVRNDKKRPLKDK